MKLRNYYTARFFFNSATFAKVELKMYLFSNNWNKILNTTRLYIYFLKPWSFVRILFNSSSGNTCCYSVLKYKLGQRSRRVEKHFCNRIHISPLLTSFSFNTAWLRVRSNLTISIRHVGAVNFMCIFTYVDAFKCKYMEVTRFRPQISGTLAVAFERKMIQFCL